MLKKKITAAVLILMLILPIFAVSTLAAYTDRLYDEAGLLDIAEKERLYDKFEEVSDRHSCDIAAAIVNSYSESDIVKAADDYYDGKNLGQGSDGSGILLYICMGSREYAFSTKGFGITAFNDNALSYLEDRVIGLLSDGDYYEAFSEYAKSADYLLGLAEDGAPYGTSDISQAHTVIVKDPGGFHPKQIIAAFVVAFIIALIVTLILKAQLRSIRKQTTASSYVNSEGLKLTGSRDIFLYRTVTKVRKSQNNGGGSSSGRSTIHMSSGGSFHGGSHGKF